MKLNKYIIIKIFIYLFKFDFIALLKL